MEKNSPEIPIYKLSKHKYPLSCILNRAAIFLIFIGCSQPKNIPHPTKIFKSIALCAMHNHQSDAQQTADVIKIYMKKS